MYGRKKTKEEGREGKEREKGDLYVQLGITAESRAARVQVVVAKSW